MSNTCQGIPPISDISGIGVRLNFYVTIFITAVISLQRISWTWKEKLLNDLWANAGLMGFGLFITAVIQTVRESLDLYHAIFVLNILYFLGAIVYFPAMLQWTFTRIHLAAIIHITIAVAFLAWALFIWVNVDTFGSSPECNADIKYVIFLFSVGATASWLRTFWIIILGISAGSMVMVIIIAIFLASSWWARWKLKNEDVLNPLRAWYKYVIWLEYSLLMSSSGVAVAMLEFFVQRNKQLILPGENDWAFGQVLSLVILVASLKEILYFLMGKIGQWLRGNSCF